jgi:hypothetical protein
MVWYSMAWCSELSRLLCLASYLRHGPYSVQGVHHHLAYTSRETRGARESKLFGISSQQSVALVAVSRVRILLVIITGHRHTTHTK